MVVEGDGFVLKIRVRISSLVIFLCAFIWCTPQGLNLLFSQYAHIFNMVRCLMWGILLFWVIIKKKKIGPYGIMLHCFWIIFLICVIFANFTITNLNTWLLPFCSVCGFCLLTILYSVKNVTKCFFDYFYIISVINLILLFIMPKGFAFQVTAYDGLNKYDTFSNFISTDNTYAPFLICFLLLGELCKARISKKMYIGMWIIALITAIKIWSATCLIGLFVYILILFSRNIKNALGEINIRKIVIAFGVLFIFIYYFKIQNLFAFIFVNILGKDLTLTGRVELWGMSIEMIKDKWLIGWGNKNNGAIILRGYYYWYAHNIVLDILLQGGVVTLASFAMLLGALKKQIKAYMRDDRVKKCLIAMVVFMILNLTESYFNSLFFYIPMTIVAGIGMELRCMQKSNDNNC